ncbi:MAG: glycosyltransferase [Saprospirales bacterium]|nr:glycosyltransferase [Saprospirales bacterium]
MEYQIRLFFYLLQSRFQALCAIDLDTILPVWIAGRLKGAMLLYDAHEYFSEVPEVIRRPAIRRVWEGVAWWCIPRMDKCYTVGPALAGIFSARYGKPFEVIRNLPLARPDLFSAKPPYRPLFFYQGALNEGRGLEALLEVMPSFPHATLWLAGEGDLSHTLRDKVRKLGLESQVRFLGFIQPADLPALTRKATLGFNLLENAGLSYYYSLANKAFDYIQAGIPSVHMDFPEYRSLQEEYGVFHLVPDLKRETLVGAIKKLLVDKAYYESLRENCRHAAEELVWEKEEKRLLEIYKMG